jgi:hypothetical protein
VTVILKVLTGFSPRKKDFSIYVMTGFETYPEIMAKLGKYKHGKSCLYIKSLSDVDSSALKALVSASVEDMRKKYG